jgi:alcohol dehydrogenase class IV
MDINKISVFLAPRKTILGKDAVAQLGKEANALGAKKVLIVTDPGVAKAGLCQIVQEVLNKASISTEIFDKVEPEPPVRVVEACIAAIKADDYDLIVGLGGGSAPEDPYSDDRGDRERGNARLCDDRRGR